MEPRVKITQLIHKLKTLMINFIGKSFAANIFGSESIAYHNVALFSFNDQIWLHQWQNIVQHWTSCLPIIDRSCELLFACPSIARVSGSSKGILQPNNKFFIAACYFEHGVPLHSRAIFTLLNMAYIYASLSIDEACKISYLSDIMISFKFNNFTHELPFVYSSIALNENKIYAERLSGMAPFGDAIV